MMRKKAKKRKAVIKKTAAAPKKKGAPRTKKEMNPAEVRKGLSKLVGTHATKMTKAVISQGETGQLAPLKYLLEMANIFPQATDGSQTTTEEESLAQTLLRRLQIPLTPVAADEYEKECEEPSEIAEKTTEEKQASAGDESVELRDKKSAEVSVG